jgi:hypothetical protein
MDLLKILIERADAETLNVVKREVFASKVLGGRLSREEQVLQTALSISDRETRRAWINEELRRMGSPLTPRALPGPAVPPRCDELFGAGPAGPAPAK